MKSKIGRQAILENHEITLEFDDYEKLKLLLGNCHDHIKLIETGLNVKIYDHSHILTCSGHKPNVELARKIILSLWEKVKMKNVLTKEDVETALRVTRDSKSKQSESASLKYVHDQAHVIKTAIKHISPRSKVQADYVQHLGKSDLVIATGPAGTGKSYLAVAKAVEMYLQGKIERIILTRPAVEAGENLGFLPGDLKEKIDPYLRPLFDALYDMLPPDQIIKLSAENVIEVAPLAYMRGRTLNNAYIILDEAQNTTHIQMKMFLTRMGDGSQMVINGDISQIDLPSGQESGLVNALRILKGIKKIPFIVFTSKDVVRHPLVAEIVDAYEKNEKKK